MCSGYYNPHIKGANYRYNALQFMIVLFLNRYIFTACVTVCYNALQSVN